MCANCGGLGHIYRVCNHPISSFGIVCFRLVLDAARSAIVPQYLMVQRQDSLCYVEFIRAKWNPQNRKYLLKLFASMTPSERERLAAAQDFDEQWSACGHNDSGRSYMKEYTKSRDQFKALRTGFPMRLASGEVIVFSLAYLLENTTAEHAEPEWGWPKGRRNINESDLRCALREFTEETGITAREVSVLTSAKPFEEVFNGCNGVRYRHVYYVTALINGAEAQGPHSQLAHKLSDAPEALPPPAHSKQEIRNVAWCSHDDVLANIREHNVERKELFKRIHALVKTQTSSNAAPPP